MITQSYQVTDGDMEKPLRLKDNLVYKYGYIRDGKGYDADIYTILSAHTNKGDSIIDKERYRDNLGNLSLLKNKEPVLSIIPVMANNGYQVIGYYLIVKDNTTRGAMRKLYRKKSTSAKRKMVKRCTCKR